ncbi:MAG: sigma 54-interacting transcriptional regulator [Romboutsia sp.]
MKKISIISLGDETGKYLKIQLDDIFKKSIKVEYYSLNYNVPSIVNSDLIVFSSEDVANIFLEKNSVTQKYITVRRVIQHELLDKLFTLKEGTHVLLVNDTQETCEISIKQLIGHGVDHLVYHPYYPDIEQYKKLPIAITPGEENLVPKEVDKLINIGTRHTDAVSIMEIIIQLGEIEKYSDLLSSYSYRKILEQYKKYIQISNKSKKLTKILQDILDNSSEGIIYINRKEEILAYNKVCTDILDIEDDIVGKNIYDLFPQIKEELTIINSSEIFVTTKKMYSKNELVGYMIVLENSEMVEKLDEERRRKKKHNNRNTKYTFDSMIGYNDKILKLKKLAKKVAKTNSTVLIQGESGTGKEILAQALHNESDRFENKFIAINFSALSENLLESELFGYEEGAFTGAQKGGKVGLFKKAHKGTIFLDEIGDAPYHFQRRLLRVLQEREITPVGSCEPIPIDVRVIAATNRDLLEEVKNNRFREDLFYRINVMPLYTVNLRDRKDDIHTLISYFLYKQKVQISLEQFLEEEVISFLYHYNWPGNIRELINITEFLVNIKEDNIKIKLDDLPRYMMRYKENYLLDVSNYKIGVNNDDEDNITINELIKTENYLNDDEIWVLQNVYYSIGIGRRALTQLAIEECIELGEGKIRGILNRLNERRYIEINKGAKGTKITDKGIRYIENGTKKG